MDETVKAKKSVKQPGLPVKQGKFTKIARILLFVAVFGSLIGFIPSQFLSGVFFKAGLVYIGIVSAFVLTVFVSLKANEITLPNNILQYVLPVLPVVYLVSAIVNPSWSTSSIGHGFEIGTLAFITVLTLLVYITTTILREKKYVSIFQSLMILSAVILFVVQMALIFTPDFLGLSKILNSPISNFIGNLNDLGVFFGATLMLSLSFIELSKSAKTSRIFAYIISIASLFMLAFAGFAHLWIVIGLFALFMFITLYVYGGQSHTASKGRFANPSFIVTVIAAIFILFGPNISNQIYKAFDVSGSDLYPPTISQTLPVISESFSDNPLLGVGPNRFSSEWVKHKPAEINSTLLWSVDYNYGNSMFLTSIVTTGLLGAVAWLAVLGALVLMGVRHVFAKRKETGLSYLTFSSFILAVYMWVIMFIHVPSAGIFTLAFMSLGMFLVSLYTSGALQVKTYRLDSKPNMSFGIVLVMSLLMIGGVAFDYLALSKGYASYTYQKALTELRSNNFDGARDYMNKAVSFGGSDIYYRGLSNVYVREMQVRAPELTSNPTDKERQIIENLFSRARAAAEQAWSVNETNYQNYMSIGGVMRIYVSPDNDKAYIASSASFKKAFELSPTNPSILLALANVEIVRGDQEKAVEYLAQALELKPNYTQARFMWAQMQAAQGDIDSAIELLSDAVSLAPRDSGVQFQLGLLRFEKGDYLGAAGSFERVLQLIPNHANARYYFALSLAELDRIDEALILLEQIKQTNPSNALLEETINRLTQPEPEVIDASIEDLDELPIEENDPVSEEIPEEEEE